MATEHPALVAAARHGLPGVAPRIVTIDGATQAQQVLYAAARDRIVGLLGAVLAAGDVSAPPELTERVTEQWHDQLIAAVDLETILIEVARTLDEAQARWCVIKGAAAAHLDYPDPALRTFGDLDILIHPDSWAAALTHLAAAGWTRELAALSSDWDQRFGKGATLTNDRDLELDLHRRLAIGRFGVLLDTRKFFEQDHLESIALGGRRIPVLGGPDRLIQASFHAALGGFRRLRAFRDVAQILLVTEVDWRQSIERAGRVQAVLAAAIQETWKRLELEIDHPAEQWARAHRPKRLEKHALDVFAREAPFRQQALTAVPALIGRGATRYLWDLIRKPGRRG